MTSHDVTALARIHRAAFPGFFLSTLGERFLIQFYRGFLGDRLRSPSSPEMPVASRGAVVGTTEPQGFFGWLLRHQWAGFLAASVAAVLWHRRRQFGCSEALRYRGDVLTTDSSALLSSICVEPDWQGRGLGGRLLKESGGPGTGRWCRARCTDDGLSGEHSDQRVLSC